MDCSKEEYFKRMRETSEISNELIKEYCSEFESLSKQLFDILMIIPNRRTPSRPSIRPNLIRNSYEICGGKDWINLKELLAASDLKMDSYYYVNWVYDDKFETKSEEQKKSAINASLLMKPLGNKAILDWAKKTKNYKLLPEILKCFNESDLATEKGQRIDVFENIWSEEKNEVFEIQLERYIKRTELMSGIFHKKLCKVGALLAGASKEKEEALENFGMNYALAGQIMNDLGDYAPEKFETAAKLNDSHSDFKHGKLTLPLIYSLHNSKDEEKNKLIKYLKKRDKLSQNELLEISKIIAKSGAVEYSKQVIKSYSKKARSSLKIFSKEQRKWLEYMLVLCESNKYYKVFDELR